MGLARDDQTLSDTWEKAKDGTLGMLVEDGLLFHRDELEGKSCKEIVLVSTWLRSVLELAYDTLCGVTFLSVVDLCTHPVKVIALRGLMAKATCQALLGVFAA
ncbi:putative polyprotein of retroviral origin [Ixodes scapularis]